LVKNLRSWFDQGNMYNMGKEDYWQTVSTFCNYSAWKVYRS
jgi:hypothetical protein